MRIAVDILGGDHAPGELLAGVARALREGFEPSELLLVGPADVIGPGLEAAGVTAVPEILETAEVIEGHEKPTEGLRRKPRASISLCVGAVREGRADGLVSFGNTGAAVAAATVGLGMLPGIRRPGIAVTMQGAGGRFVLLDAGANPTPRPRHLFQYGIMGSVFAASVLGIERPRVGLLNIGGEAGKGNPVIQEAHALLQGSGLNFVGNLEGQDLFRGTADVLVGDGFVGNMVLKVVEGFAEFLAQGLARQAAEAGDAAAEESLREGLRRLFGAADYADVGGAVLLGVNGSVFIGHGRSQARAVHSALKVAREDIESGVNRKILEQLRRELEGAAPDESSSPEGHAG